MTSPVGARLSAPLWGGAEAPLSVRSLVPAARTAVRRRSGAAEVAAWLALVATGALAWTFLVLGVAAPAGRLQAPAAAASVEGEGVRP